MRLDLDDQPIEEAKEETIQVMMNSPKRQVTKVSIVEEGISLVLTIHFGPIPA